jgi:hypothetical protein
MKKNERKAKALRLNRETIVRLNPTDLANIVGGLAAEEKCTGCVSGCGIYYETQ